MTEITQAEYIKHIYDKQYSASEDRDGKMHYYREEEK